MQKENKSARLVQGNVARTLIMLTLPMILAMIGMLSFNLIDTYFVGQLGTNQLAAISFTFPITYIVTALSLGIGTGASAVVSKAIGANNQRKATRVSSDSLMLGLIIVGIFLIIGMLTIDPLFRALGAEGQVLELVKDYMYIWYPGMIFVVVPMVGNALIRATGDTKTPSAVMMLAVVVNLILDPILIFGWGFVPSYGIEGAALATVISRAITLVFSLWILYKREKIVSFEIPKLKEAWQSWKSVLYIGLPSAGTSLIVPVGASVVISIVAVYGSEAVAGFGVASRVEALSLTVIMALGSVLGPFIGQNLGAKKFDRVIKGINLSYMFGIVWSIAVAIFLVIFGEPIGAIFNEDPTVISVINDYLWIVPFTFGFQSIIMLTVVAFNVLHKPFYGGAIAVFRMLILYVPLAYLGSYLFGLWGIFGAASISNLAAGILSYIWLKNYIYNEKDKIEAAEAAEAAENDDEIDDLLFVAD